MDSLGGFKPNPALHIMDEHPGMGAISFSPARVEAEGRSLSPVVSGSSGSWEEAVAARAFESDFILSHPAGRDEDGRSLAKVLARLGWPADSNLALRRLERKLEAALEMLEGRAAWPEKGN
jgi:hypothetical protein